MSDNQSRHNSEQSYTMGYSDEFQKMLHRRNAVTNAAYLLPSLKAGLRVLDFGCGPGTISMGLAKAVEPGELHGIDIEESQIQMAQAAAKAGGHDNTVFQTADVTALPYEDETFDVAHCHAVLTHVPDTRAVLREVYRVLKPGGRIASRELIGASSFFEPAIDDFAKMWEAFTTLIETNQGHPDMGKELKGILVEVGFADVQASASFESYSAAEDVDFMHALTIGWFFADKTVDALIKSGIASQTQLDRWRRLLDQWKDSPGVFAALAWGETIGTKPLPG